MIFAELLGTSAQIGFGNTSTEPGARPAVRKEGGNAGSSFGLALRSALKTEERAETGLDRHRVPDEKNENHMVESAENRIKYVSFREAGENAGIESCGCVSPGRSAETGPAGKNACWAIVTGMPSNGDAADSTDIAVINLVAALLGICPGDIRKLQECAGETQDLPGGTTGADEAVLKLSQALGLDGAQMETLEELFRLAGKALEFLKTGRVGEQEILAANGGNTAADALKAGMRDQPLASGMNEAAAVTPEGALFVEKLAEQIKAKLDKYGIRLAGNRSGVEEEIRAAALSVADGTGIMRNLKLNGEQTAAEMVPEPGGKTLKTGEKPAGNMSGSGDASKSENEEKVIGSEEEGFIGANRTAESPETVKNGGLQLQVRQPVDGVDSINPVAGRTVVTPARPREILDQVLEKVKASLAPGKSEITVELKPESLGRLSLKVSSENGTVMAKFVAESQQVRQILEANMHELKDSLARHGINVQSLSVSVRQDSGRYARDGFRPETGGKTLAGGKAYRVSGAVDRIAVTDAGAVFMGAAYMWEGSTINLTA